MILCEDRITEKCAGFDSPCALRAPIRLGRLAGVRQIDAVAQSATRSGDVACAAIRPEGDSNRVQQWLARSPDAATAAHAFLYRPSGEGPFRLAIIAHASAQNVLRRTQSPQPEYRAGGISGQAGFAVLVIRTAGSWPATGDSRDGNWIALKLPGPKPGNQR
jgi:hypothetical protein